MYFVIILSSCQVHISYEYVDLEGKKRQNRTPETWVLLALGKYYIFAISCLPFANGDTGKNTDLEGLLVPEFTGRASGPSSVPVT